MQINGRKNSELKSQRQPSEAVLRRRTLETMPLKRPRASPEPADTDTHAVAASVELQPTKKPRLDTPSTPAAVATATTTTTTTIPDEQDRISALSDELLVRILASLAVPQLLDLSLVSRRFWRLACDSQLWKAHYYSRFVLPRALRIPGFRGARPAQQQRQDHKLHYSGRKALWADGRRGGIHEQAQCIPKPLAAGEAKDDAAVPKTVDWMRQFRTRHNWSKGTCAVEELRLGDGSPARNNGQAHADGRPRMLVKVVEGIAVTADAESGLRAWDLRTREIMAQTSLRPAAVATRDAPGKMPSCLAVDEDRAPDNQTLRIALGFCDGSFGVWLLDMGSGGKESVLSPQYRHEPSPGGRLAGMAYSHPFLLAATDSVHISLYTFDGPSADVSNAQAGGGGNKWPAPSLLTSLESVTSEPPLALSVRRAGASTTIASIAYTFVTRQGWSIGVQDLHVKTAAPTADTPRPLPEVGSTRLAHTEPVSTGRARRRTPRQRRRQDRTPRIASSSDEDADDADDDDDNDGYEVGPTALCYTHPYLLATLPDNTLVLHLCTSSAASLAVSRGIRLWGHTSGISDAEITSRGRAVSVSARGDEMRVWELEGGGRGHRRTHDGGAAAVAHDLSVEVRAARSPSGEAAEPAAWEDRRNWVGFDDEMVIVLKERADGGDSLMVYDFT
ncbi:hypothetical protein RB594_006375 [Gaeumannomyces avenae]